MNCKGKVRERIQTKKSRAEPELCSKKVSGADEWLYDRWRRTWEGSGSVLGRVVWMMWVMRRRHATHGPRWVEGRHGIERGHHGGW